jgi:hypothetical protein
MTSSSIERRKSACLIGHLHTAFGKLTDETAWWLTAHRSKLSSWYSRALHPTLQARHGDTIHADFGSFESVSCRSPVLSCAAPNRAHDFEEAHEGQRGMVLDL